MTAAPVKPLQLKELSPAGRAAVESRRIVGGWEPRALSKLLHELERFDAGAEKAIASAQKWFIASLVLAFFGFVGFIFLIAVFWPLALLVLAAAGANVFFSFRRWNSAKKLDLPNELRLSIRPLLARLSQDIAPGEKIRVEMDLSGATDKKAQPSQSYPSRGRGTVTQTIYRDPWCRLRLPLADGATAVIAIESLLYKRVRSYRSSRGKSKSKTKWKKVSTVTTSLLPPHPVAWNQGALQLERQRERFALIDREGTPVPRLERWYEFKAISDPPPEAPPAKEILGMFLRLYALAPAAAGGRQ